MWTGCGHGFCYFLRNGPVLCDLPFQEIHTAGELIHAVHAILDADPAIEADALQLGKNGIEIIEAATENRNNGTPETITPDTIIIGSGQIEVTKQRLWERKLLDLSLRNNLLNIKLTKNTMQLISVNICTLEDALTDGQEFQVLAKPTDWNNNMMDAGIRRRIRNGTRYVDRRKRKLLHAWQTQKSRSDRLRIDTDHTRIVAR